MLKGAKKYRCKLNKYLTRIIENDKPLVYITLESHIRGIPVVNITLGAINEYHADELYAAVLHELGHYHKKHALKNLIGLLMFQKPDLLEQEKEADRFAVHMNPGVGRHLIRFLSRNKERNEERIKALKNLCKIK